MNPFFNRKKIAGFVMAGILAAQSFAVVSADVPDYVLPVSRTAVLSETFTEEANNYLVSSGSSVMSVSEGEVIKAEYKSELGYHVAVKNEAGEVFYYCFLQRNLEVKEGDKVKAGDKLGTSGSAGLMSFKGRFRFFAENAAGEGITETVTKRIYPAI